MARKKKRKFSAAQLRAQKLFAKRAKAGTLKKKKRKAVKRKAAKRKNPVKRTRPRVKRKTARRRTTARPRRAAAKRKNPTRRRRTTSRWIIKANRPMKTGYKFYYLRGDQFVLNPDHATKHASVAACHRRMRKIQPDLPYAISSITCLKV